MNEQISALADNEIALKDVAYLMTAMQPNSPSVEAWHEYHLIGDVMRGTPLLSANFKENLMAKIDSEPTVLAPNAALVNLVKTHSSTAVSSAAADKHGKMPIAWSIAASFAAVMVVAWSVLQMQVTDNVTPTLAQAETAQAVPEEYLMAHQSSAPSASSYYIQSVSYSE